MSRSYQMDFTLDTSTFSPEEWPKIKELLTSEWSLDDLTNVAIEHWGGTIMGSGQHSLYGGETEEEFAKRITHGIWELLGHFARINILATYLEELPCNQYELKAEDYAEWLEKQQSVSTTPQPTHEPDPGTL